MGWFSSKPVKVAELPTSTVDYPDGTCVFTESGMYYLSGGTKFFIENNRVYNSWKFPLTVNSTDQAISNYKKSIKPLNYRPGTLVRDVHTYELFVAARNGRVPLDDADIYQHLNIDEGDIVFASSAEVKRHRRAKD